MGTATAHAGQRHELARYTAPDGERLILAQRVDGRVRISDRPAPEGGRAYLIARWVQSQAELDALLSDYLGQAERYGDCPMHCRW